MQVVDTIINYNTRQRPQESLVVGEGISIVIPTLPPTIAGGSGSLTLVNEHNKSGFAKLLFEEITFGQ